MKQFIWKKIARTLATPRIADALIRYAKKTPYMHLPSDSDPSYMERYWVFNPYDRVTNKPRFGWIFPWSIRVHHIKREDSDRHLHTHPWNARTIILKGWYIETRDTSPYPIWRQPGDTATLGTHDLHKITEVSEGGVFTLFISGPWMQVWGFLVDGKIVPWKTYLGIKP